MRLLLQEKLATPVDCGAKLADHKPVFGYSKTWRGIAGAIILTSVAAAVLGYEFATGAQIAIYALSGDLFSSFIKRRLGMAPSSMAPLLDQVPESLLPALMLKNTFGLDMQAIIILVGMFIVLELMLSYLLFKLGIRKRPY
jgi:CDP-2,3-bis-(O-geranylgeranyl)-sn-glycerol synthase